MRFPLPAVAGIGNARSELDLAEEALATSVGGIVSTRGVGGYEPETIGAALALVSTFRLRNFVDIGANIGIFSLVLKSVFGDSLHVRAHEPLPRLLRICRSLAQGNGLEIECKDQALSDSSGTAKFYVSRKSDSSNSLNATFRPAKGVIDVVVATVDELYGSAADTGWLLKIDTESTEPDVLRGASGFIRRFRPWIICEVLHGRGEDRLQEEVERHGYQAFHLTGDALTSAQPILGDSTYRHRDWLLAPDVPDAQFNAQYARWQEALRAVAKGLN